MYEAVHRHVAEAETATVVNATRPQWSTQRGHSGQHNSGQHNKATVVNTTVVNTTRPTPSHHLADKDALAVGQQPTLAVGQQPTLAVGQQPTLGVGQQQTLAVGHGTTANSTRDLGRDGLCPASALSLAMSRVCP